VIIAAFDLDGTLTRRDTMVDFLLETVGYRKLTIGVFLNGFMLLQYMFGLISNEALKQALFKYFFEGWRAEEFEKRCRDYSFLVLPRLLKEEAISRCEWHKKQGHELVCISASIRNWIEPWALQYGFRYVMATEIETESGVITGYFKGKNCYGAEKVRRFLEVFPQRNNYTLFAYGNSRGDRELLSFADYAFLRKYQ
jgi:phosphatidylglycerophosphatase C